MIMNNVLEKLTESGVSIWLDDLSRHRIISGNLADYMNKYFVRGVTTNPSIFHSAIAKGSSDYANQIKQCAEKGLSADETIRLITTDDVRSACDILAPVYQSSKGVDGRVSIEVDPRLAHDTAGTIAAAEDLWALVGRPNLFIKIPATKAGLPAITQVIALGISVNVTLIFSVDRYKEVMDAYTSGLELAVTNGIDISSIESVASFFVSRVDTDIDAKLTSIGTPSALTLRGQAAIANARLAWQAHLDHLASPRWQSLTGAKIQRPLWASTGVKDPAYPDTRYVLDLVAPGCVNTMPEGTLLAVADHGLFIGDTVSGTAAASANVWAELAGHGIDQKQVCDNLEAEGVDKFAVAWSELLETVNLALAAWIETESTT